MYKVVEGLVPAIPRNEFLKPTRQKRQVSFFLLLLAWSHAIITPGSVNFEEKNKTKKQNKKNKKNLSAVTVCFY